MQHILEFAVSPAFDRASLLASPANEEAVEWIDRWPEWPRPVMALYGPKGCGKTHLAHIWQGRARASFLRPADLTEISLAALAANPCSVVIDDAEGVAGDAEGERRLFHLYNLLAEARQSLLLASRQPPARYSVDLPDLASRLGSVQAIAIGQPDDLLLSRVFGKLFADRQVFVQDDIISYLLARMERSFAGAERVAARLDELSLVHKKPVTLALARQVLEEDGHDRG